MKQLNIFLMSLLIAVSGMMQGQLYPFKDDVESHPDFQQTNLMGWTSLDLDGYNTAGPFQSFPGKGGPLGFMVYTPSQTNPPNILENYIPKSGKKYFVSISNYYGPNNDWLISSELIPHQGGVFSFYAKSAADFSGNDRFKVAYSTTGTNPADFVFLNNGSATQPTLNWNKFEFTIPAGAKHIAINCISEAFMFMVDDLEFAANVSSTAPNIITDFTSTTEIGSDFKAKFTWKNPTTDHAGNPLTSMTGVKVYRGTHPMSFVEIADLPSSPGQSMTYTDTLPAEGDYLHRFVAYNNSGNGKPYDTPLTFFGYETVAGAPANINFSRDASLHTVITWDPVNYGANGGVLQDPVIGYKIVRTLGTTSEVLAESHSGTSFTENAIPELNLYAYTITALTGPTSPGVPATVTAYSGMNADQVSVTSKKSASPQPFELSRGSIISQSIYKPEEIGTTGLITSISYFGNLGTTSTSRYKIYMSTTNRNVFGTTLNNAVWEYFGNQKLLFDGNIEFKQGVKATTIELDQPFFYDAASNQNVIITIVKPLTENIPSVNPRDFYNTPVEGMRTYYSNGYTIDLSEVVTQPAAWSTEEITTIPSIVVEKNTNYGKVSGTVTLAADGSPLENVTVKITPADASTYQNEITLSATNGNYVIPALIAGNYTATFSKNTFNTVQLNFSLADNQQLTLDAVMDNSLPIIITGNITDVAGNALQGINVNLTGFSEFSTTTNATGNYSLEAFADKDYQLKASHPLFVPKTIDFTSEGNDHVLAPIVLDLALNKPGNVAAVNNNGVGEVSWRVPVGHFNETMLGWGSFSTTGDAWGNGGDPFIAGIRFETTDLQGKLNAGAELTHVKVYFANHAKAIIKVFEGANAQNLIHSQPVNITDEDWYMIELTKSLPIDLNKELWIGVEFLSGQYGAYPIGLDDGPNAPGRKGSMKFENGSWAGMSLTNKNWNIYGIANNTMDAAPTGYRVYRSPAAENNWTDLTPNPITATTFQDVTLNDAAPNMYKYGVAAEYGPNLISEKGISNEIQHKMFFDFTVNVTADHGSAEGAYISVSNDDNFAEAKIPASGSVTFTNLLHGDYNIRVELDNYHFAELSNIIIDDNTSMNIPLNLRKVQPSNLKAELEGNKAVLNWTLHEKFTDQIEKYNNFERNTIGNYILKDLDGLETYTYTNFNWPNAGVPMSYMVFNPFATTPPVVSIDAFSGRRFLTAFAGPDGPNNDWLIIPAGEGEFTFKAASLVATMPEKIRVLYSTTGAEVADFTAFGSQINVPVDWTNYTYNAPEGTKYVAINFVSNDSYILKVDDLTYHKEYNHALYYNVYLDGNLVMSNLTNQTFTLENLSPGSHTAEVEAIYDTGASEKTEIILSVLGVEDQQLKEFMIYPNPSEGRFWLKISDKATVNIYDLNGRLLFTGSKNAGTSMMEHNFPSGTYIIQVQTDKGTASKKLIIK